MEKAEAERRGLQRLNDAASGVPGVQRDVGMTESTARDVTAPLAKPLVDTSGLREVLKGAVITLEWMHALELVHQDQHPLHPRRQLSAVGRYGRHSAV